MGIVYDPVGRLTEVLPDGNPGDGAKQYTYNSAGYLIQTKTHDGNDYQVQAEMQYDGLGQRISMTGYALGTSVTTQYVLDPLNQSKPLLADSSGNTTTYLYGVEPIAEITTEWAYSLNDGVGSARQLVDENGDITLTGAYTPWGDTLEYNGTGNFTFGYFGGLMDAATGLIYIGNGQYYDPSTGRLLTRDAQPNKTNPYVPWGDPASALFVPIALIGLLYGKKHKKNRIDYFIITLLLVFGVGMSLSACGPTPPESPTNTPVLPTVPVTIIHAPTETPPETETPLPIVPDNYDEDEAVSYALNEWAFDMSESTSSCSAFISKMLEAAGVTDPEGIWTSNSVSTIPLYNFLSKNYNVISFTAPSTLGLKLRDDISWENWIKSQRLRINAGDIVFFKVSDNGIVQEIWDHASVIVDPSSTETTLYASKSLDGNMKPRIVEQDGLLNIYCGDAGEDTDNESCAFGDFATGAGRSIDDTLSMIYQIDIILMQEPK